MPYYHRVCGGEVSLARRRCRLCGHRWPLKVLWAKRLPDDMEFTFAFIPPTVDGVVKRLPKWPRWARILTVIAFFAVCLLVLRFLFLILRGY